MQEVLEVLEVQEVGERERGSNQRRELASNGGEGGLPGFVARAYVSLVVYGGESTGEGRTRAFKARVDKDKLSL